MDEENEELENKDDENPQFPEGEEESRWINQTQTRTLKQINTNFTVHENSPDNKSQSANQDKIKIQPILENGEYRIKISGKLSEMSKWISSESYHNEEPHPWYGFELVFYENPVDKVKFDDQYLTEWDLFYDPETKQKKNSTVLWIDLDDANTGGDIYFSLEYNGVKEIFRITFINLDEVKVNPDLFPSFGQDYVEDPERKRSDWINSGQTRLINKRSTEFKIEEKSKEGIDQASNQSKITITSEVDEDGTYTIDLSGKLSEMSKWSSTDPAHADKLSPWYGIEFCFYDNPVKKVKFNGYDLEESDIVDKEKNSIILWLDLDNLVNKSTTFTLEEDEVKETFRVSFTNLDVNVNVDPNLFPGFGQDYVEDPERKESDWINKHQTRLLKDINTIFEVPEESPDNKSQSANQKKVIIQPGMDQDNNYTIKLSGRLSGMSKWTSSDPHQNDQPYPWYGIELVFYENPIGKIKFDGQELTDWDIFNRDTYESIILWLNLEDVNSRDIVFTLSSDEVTEKYTVSFTNIDNVFPNPIVKVLHITIHKNDGNDDEETQNLNYIISDGSTEGNYERTKVTIGEIIDDLSENMIYRQDDDKYIYSFDGLSLNDDSEETLEDDFEITSDIDLYIQWYKFNLNNEIDITVHKNDGSGTTEVLHFVDNTKDETDDVTVEKIIEQLSEEFKKREDDEKNVYNFIGLSDTPNGTEPLEEDFTFINDKDLYLIWSTDAKASQFKITVHKNDGSDEKKEFVYIDYDYTKDDDLTINKVIDILKEDLDETFMVRDNDDIYEYTFKGLSFVPNGVALPNYTRIVTNKELYIVWDKTSIVKTIKVKVYKNDDSYDNEVLTFDDVLDDSGDDITVGKVLASLSEEFKFRSDVEDYGYEWIVIGLTTREEIMSDGLLDLNTRITEDSELYLQWDYVLDEHLWFINQIKIKKIIKKLNKKFYEELYDCFKIIKSFTENNSLYQIFDKVRANDTHYAEMFANMYNKIVKVFSVLFYTVNISDIIANNQSDLKCYPYEIAKWFLENNLSKADSLKNFVGIKQYFVKDVASKIFTENFYDNYDRFLSLEHPVIDEIETGNINFPIEQVVFHFAENLFNFRELMRNTDFYWQEDHLTDDSYQNAYGLFLYCVINFMQLFYMESYLSDNKFQVRTQVKNIIKAFIPDCDGFVTYEDIVSFIQITT